MRGDQVARQWRVIRTIESGPNGLNAGEIANRGETGIRTICRYVWAILGAFSRITGMVAVESVIEAVKEFVPSNKAGNAAATKEAYERAKK